MAQSVVLVAGNIGAGKSTLLEYIEKEKEGLASPFSLGGIKVVPEFIDPALRDLFYKDRRKYTSWFEQSCLIGRIGRYLQAKSWSEIVFFDRGMIEGAETFCRNSYEEGYLRRDAFDLYQKILFNGLDDLDRTQQERWLERLVVYLQVQDERILLERSKKRKIEGEKDIPLDYFQKINQWYAQFIDRLPSIYQRYELKSPEVLVVDASVDFHENPDYLSNTSRSIFNELKNLISNEPL